MLITEPTPYDDEIDISIAVDPELQRTALLYTNGLVPFGVPDLALEPPVGFDLPNGQEWPEFSHFLAHALWTMAVAVLDAGDAEVLPLVTEHHGAEVSFWVSDEAPHGPAIRHLADDDLVEVACSLWWSSLQRER